MTIFLQIFNQLCLRYDENQVSVLLSMWSHIHSVTMVTLVEQLRLHTLF